MATTILIIGGILVLILFGVGLFITLTQEKSLVEQRLDEYLQEQPMEFGTSEDEGKKQEGSFLTNLLSQRLEGTSFADRVKESLARADLKMKVGEYFALMLISSFGTGIIGFFVFGGGFGGGLTAQVFMLLGFIVGFFLPNMYVKRQQKTRLTKFSDQLPDMLTLMVNGIRAGYSTMQAIESISKEMPPPISGEFRRVYQEMQLGIPMEASLENLLRRIPSEDLDLVVTAMNVQREVGGNLSEILETITHTIRERIRIKGEIKTLTAQVVYSGRFLALMPVFISGILWLLNRAYMMQFFLEPKMCGIGILTCGAIMIMIGFFVMNKIADIQV